MKKLLITTMVAVSVGLCAKAEDYTKTSFENYAAGDALLINAADEGDVWTSLATDPLFVISNLTDFAKGSKASRPDLWANENDLRALTIDTDAPLFCHLKNNTDYNLSNGPMFFDSVVQFTATDVAAEPNGLDKLRVWLYASPEDSEGRLFNETQPITNLVITAGYYDNVGNKVSTNYLTNVSIQPDTWHRLTIKAINNIEIHTLPTPGFEVYVDGDSNPVSGKCDYVGENPVPVTKFPSLVARNVNGENSLQCVAFDGKGAVDDIVFTTTDPFYVPPVEAETYAIVATCDNASTSISFSLDEAGNESLNDVSALDVKTTTVYGYVIPESGYEVTSAKFNGSDLVVPEFDGLGYTFLLPIGTPKNGDEYAFVVTVTKKSEGGEEPDPEEPTTPTVGGTSCETEAALKAVVKAGTQVTVPSGWTVDGKVLKDNTGATFATFEYYNLALVDGVVTATLDQKAAAPFAEATEDQEVLDLDATMKDDENNDVPAVGIRIKTFNGLYYGLGTATQLGTWTGPASWTQSDSDGKIIQLVAPKQGDTRFYRIEVRDVDPTPAAQ